jgi:hypothetical protein
MEIDQQASFNWLRSHPTAFPAPCQQGSFHIHPPSFRPLYQTSPQHCHRPYQSRRRLSDFWPVSVCSLKTLKLGDHLLFLPKQIRFPAEFSADDDGGHGGERRRRGGRRWGGRRDLNPRQPDPQSGALTKLSYDHHNRGEQPMWPRDCSQVCRVGEKLAY